MSKLGSAAVVIFIFILLTLGNVAVYSEQMRRLNDVPLRSNPLGGDAYQIGAQAARHHQALFWFAEGVIVVVCGAAWLFAGRKKDS